MQWTRHFSPCILLLRGVCKNIYRNVDIAVRRSARPATCGQAALLSRWEGIKWYLGCIMACWGWGNLWLLHLCWCESTSAASYRWHHAYGHVGVFGRVRTFCVWEAYV
eukprot:jgi/Botrbrau1/22041/Bobra.0024s0053.1